MLVAIADVQMCKYSKRRNVTICNATASAH